MPDRTKDMMDALQYIMDNMATKDRVDQRIQGIESYVDQRMQKTEDHVDQRIQGIESYVDQRMQKTEDRVDQRIQGIESYVDQRMQKTEVMIETRITKRLDALTDGYKSVHEKQWELERQNEHLLSLLADLQNRVAALEDKTA